nr:MAG TPA: hypothetical protein [Caudoviricetes sp.]
MKAICIEFGLVSTRLRFSHSNLSVFFFVI